MRRVRGLIALAISLGIAFLAAKAVYWYLNKPQPSPQPVTTQLEMPAAKPASFADRIPNGMRVFNIRVNDVSGISRELRPGDHVDVVAVGDIGGKTKGKVSRIVMQNVAVLTSGVTSSDGAKPGRPREREWTVSLLVTPDQGTLLSVVAATDELQLLPRSPGDKELTDVPDMAYTAETGVMDLKSPPEDLLAGIPSGMRAITVNVRDTDGICGQLQPGDRVDVIVTSPYSKFSSGGDVSPGAEGQVTEFRMASRVLLQNVSVLTTENQLQTGPQIDQPVKRVTLLVSPGDAEKLTVISDATKKSILRLVSRGSADQQKASTSGHNLADLLTRQREYHRIDVLRGTRMTKQTFYR